MKERIKAAAQAFDRLRYSQKFLLIGLVFILPTALVLTILVGETSSRIDLYGYHEKYGAQYLRVTRQLMEHIQEHQLLTTAALSAGAGNLPDQIAQMETQITQDFADLDQIDQKYGSLFSSSDLMRALQPRWQDLKQNWQKLNSDENLQRHTELTSDIRALISWIGNSSYLALDPDLDTYYTMDLVVFKLPEAQDLMAQTIGIGQRIVRRRTLIPDDRADLQAHTSVLQSNLTAMKASLEVAFNNNPAQNLRPALGAPVQAYLGALDQFSEALKNGITNTPKVVADPAVIVEAGRQALVQSYRLYDTASLELETLIQRRIDQLTAQQFISIFFSLLASAVAFSLGLAVMRGISRPLATLTTATQRLAAGDLTTRVGISGQSEAAQVSTAFNQMAEQLDRAQKSLELRTAQINAGAEVGRAAASLMDIDTLLRTVVELISDRFGFYYTAAFILDSTRQQAVLREATGTAGRTLKERGHSLEIAGQSMVSMAVRARKPRIALDVGAEAVRFANPLLPDTRSEIALPLVVGDRVLGALDVQSTQAGAFDEMNAAVLQSMANQIAIALSNAEQFKQTEAALQRTQELFAASQDLSTANNADAILTSIVQHAAPEAGRAGLMILGPRNEQHELAYVDFVATWVHTDYEAVMQPIKVGARLSPQHMPVVNYVTPGRPLAVNNVDADDVPQPIRMLMHRYGTAALIGLPIVAGHDWLGILLIGYRQAHVFQPDEVQTLLTLSGQAGNVLQTQRSLTETQAAVQQLNLLNRRLTGEAWLAYAKPLGGELTIQDTAPSVVDESWATELKTPLVVRGETIGSLGLQDTQSDRVWSSSDRELLAAVANEVAAAIDNARLLEQTERRVQRERLLAEISRKMLAASDLTHIARVAGEELGRALRVSHLDVVIGADSPVPDPSENGLRDKEGTL